MSTVFHRYFFTFSYKIKAPMPPTQELLPATYN
nr:MAG TPA: hypothetical protein [Caudoviricetes sp.]